MGCGKAPFWTRRQRLVREMFKRWTTSCTLKKGALGGGPFHGVFTSLAVTALGIRGKCSSRNRGRQPGIRRCRHTPVTTRQTTTGQMRKKGPGKRDLSAMAHKPAEG